MSGTVATATVALVLHSLAAVVWVGGMFFMLMCLRPAAHEVLEPPARVPLMHATLRRFFRVVSLAVLAILVSGAAMILTRRSAGASPSIHALTTATAAAGVGSIGAGSSGTLTRGSLRLHRSGQVPRA